jgi:hypothetical protein
MVFISACFSACHSPVCRRTTLIDIVRCFPNLGNRAGLGSVFQRASKRLSCSSSITAAVRHVKYVSTSLISIPPIPLFLQLTQLPRPFITQPKALNPSKSSSNNAKTIPSPHIAPYTACKSTTSTPPSTVLPAPYSPVHSTASALHTWSRRYLAKIWTARRLLRLLEYCRRL